MEKWLKKNLKYVTIIFIALFLIKTTQSCNRKMSIRVQENQFIEERDSLNTLKSLEIQIKNDEIKILNEEIFTRDFMIKDLTNDLKIAGVRVNEAQRRADAVQRTAERVKTNTTIEIRGAVRDTTQNNQ